MYLTCIDPVLAALAQVLIEKKGLSRFTTIASLLHHFRRRQSLRLIGYQSRYKLFAARPLAVRTLWLILS